MKVRMERNLIDHAIFGASKWDKPAYRTRRLSFTIVSSPPFTKSFGSFERNVFLALLREWHLQGSTSPRIFFSLKKLARQMEVHDEGRNLQNIRDAIDRLVGTTVSFQHFVADDRIAEITTSVFQNVHYHSNVRGAHHRGENLNASEIFRPGPDFVTWADDMLHSISSGHYSLVDPELHRDLGRAQLHDGGGKPIAYGSAAQAIYDYLARHASQGGTYEVKVNNLMEDIRWLDTKGKRVLRKLEATCDRLLDAGVLTWWKIDKAKDGTPKLIVRYP